MLWRRKRREEEEEAERGRAAAEHVAQSNQYLLLAEINPARGNKTVSEEVCLCVSMFDDSDN